MKMKYKFKWIWLQIFPIHKAQYTYKQLAFFCGVNKYQLLSLKKQTNKQTNKTKQKKQGELVIQDGDIWTNHLFLTKYEHVKAGTKKSKLEELELSVKDHQNPIDSPITEQKLLDQIAQKQKKIFEPDGILNKKLKIY